MAAMKMRRTHDEIQFKYHLKYRKLTFDRIVFYFLVLFYLVVKIYIYCLKIFAQQKPDRLPTYSCLMHIL